MTIKAIETTYRDCHFRSRLEARWAILLDTLGVPWEYEVEGYETEHGRYLPDFLVTLTRKQVWLEIKPSNWKATEAYEAKLRAVVEGTRKDLYVAPGLPDPRSLAYGNFNEHGDGMHVYSYQGVDNPEYVTHWDNYQTPCVCVTCGAIGFEFENRAGRICMHSSDDRHGQGDQPHPRLLGAITAAKSARFGA